MNNPSFEGITRPGGWTRNCHCGIEHPEIFTPEGWAAWHNLQLPHPEIHVIQLVPPFINPPRIADGDWAVKLFKSFSKVDAGVYQVVTGLTPGTKYVTGFKAHAWCLHDGLPHFGDPYCSVIGCGAKYWDEAAIPPRNGDPVNDAIGAALFSVGVGSTPPDLLYGITWGKKAAIYNVYQNVPELRFTAQSDTAVVYLRAELIWAYRNNDAYMDSVYLREVEAPPEPCKGLPRVDYPRIYNVIPANTTKQRATEIFQEAWDRGKETVGGSYDDAGVGDLSDKLARLYDIDETDQQRFRDFYVEHYPTTRVEFANGSPPTTLRLKYPTTHLPPVITQPFNPPNHLAIDLRSSYIHWQDEIVCAMDGLVIIAGWTSDTFGYQVVTKTILADDRTVILRYAHMLEDLYVQAGDQVVAGQKLGKAGGTAIPPVADHLHFSVNVDGRYVDPEPLIEWPEPIPPVGEIVPSSLHLQTMFGIWDQYITSVKPQVAKVTASFEDAHGILRANPTTMPIVRQPVTNDYGDVMGAPTPEAGAAIWIAKVKDALHQTADQIERDYPSKPWPLFRWESLNEMYASSNVQTMQWVIDVEIAMCDLLYEIEPRVGLCVYCAAVGNIEPIHYPLLVPLGLKAQERGAWFGYHAYWLANRVAEDWPHLAGRWTEIDKVLVAGGAHVSWYNGEGGCVGGHVNPDGGYTLLPNDGWLSPHGWNGDWDGYEEDIMKFDRLAAESVPGREGRFHGLTLFTTGADFTNWLSFQVRDDEMRSLIASYGN